MPDTLTTSHKSNQPEPPSISVLCSEGLLRPIDAANFLSVSKSTIYRLMESGRLAYLRLPAGGNVQDGDPRIPRTALLRFIEDGLARRGPQ